MKLTPGLYLVRGNRHTQGNFYYEAAPFMVMLPALDKENNVWMYDVTANIKFDSDEIPSEPELITRKVVKIWKDNGHEKERPQEVVVQLLRNDEVYDTVTLNAENNWRYSWNDLDSDCRWTVVEKELKDYNVKVTQEGSTFIVINTYDENVPTEPSNPDLPQTGQLWWPVLLLTAVGLLFLIIGLIRHRDSVEEK